MNTNDLNTALYEKMAAEQDKFREWLKIQPPEEVLNHAYEYTIREDIVMAMEELELTDTQAQALWESPSPLADVYRYFEKLETGMNQLTQPLVMGKSFFTRQSEKPSVRHRDIADNDHGAAALCDSCNFLLQLLSLEPQ